MPQVAFFVGAASSGIGGVGVLLAWDRHDRGPDAADDVDTSGVGLYSWIQPVVGAQFIRMKTKVPIQIPEANCPELPDGFPGDFIDKLEFKPGAVGLGPIAEFNLDIFDTNNNNTIVYKSAPSGESLKFELSDNSIIATAVSVFDRPTVQPWEDPLEGFAAIINNETPTKELWRALMTPNQPLDLF